MKQIRATFTGTYLGKEVINGRENKTTTRMYVLQGMESIPMTVRDAKVINVIEGLAKGEEVEVKAEIQTYKDELYVQALEVV